MAIPETGIPEHAAVAGKQVLIPVSCGPASGRILPSQLLLVSARVCVTAVITARHRLV
jgi:hypothetical protein